MKYFHTLLLFTALLIMGCAGFQPKQINLHSSFNVIEAKRLLETGNNTIRGSALIRQQGGGVVTCAGNLVELFPVTEYARERMIAIYTNEQKGYYPIGYEANKVVFASTDPEYLSTIKTTVCDAQGFFKFQNIANGTFFVLAKVIWQANSVQGGYLMHKVAVSNGVIKEIVLSP